MELNVGVTSNFCSRPYAMNQMTAPHVSPRNATTNPITCRTREAAEESYRRVRRLTERLCEPLVTEDYVIQSAPEVSPLKWHLAHTSWFFETFLLSRSESDHQGVHPTYTYLFNSYYNAVGPQHCRAQRGMISRPTVEQVYHYRAQVDQAMLDLLGGSSEQQFARLAPLIGIGLHHERQHQELMLTDIKHVFSVNPMCPVYRDRAPDPPTHIPAAQWIGYPGGLHEIGHGGGGDGRGGSGEGFAYDNETPRHRVYVHPYALSHRLVTNGEYMRFIEDGGYQRHELWLSDAWSCACDQGWEAPLYWRKRDGRWWTMTLAGLCPVDPAQPVCHVSYYEADAYARWSGARLPTEAQWELAAAVPVQGNFVQSERYHPAPLDPDAQPPESPGQMFGDVWEWTSSPYTAYPGYSPPQGALGEYNAKFMCNQFVLRGGSCATSRDHIRATYRNFFSPADRWQFSGIRLAKDA